MKKSFKIGNVSLFVKKHLEIFGQNYMRGEGSFGYTTIIFLVFMTIASGTIFGLAYLVGLVNEQNNLLLKVISSSLLLALLFTTAWSKARKGKYSFLNRLFSPTLCTGYLFIFSFLEALFFPSFVNDYMMMGFGVATSWFVYGKMILGMNMLTGYYAPRKYDFTITTEPVIVETNTPEIIVQGDKAKYVFRKRQKLGPFELPIGMTIYFTVLLLLLIGVLYAAMNLVNDIEFVSAGWRALYIGNLMTIAFFLSLASWVFNIKDQVKFYSVEEVRWQLKKIGLSDNEVRAKVDEFYRAGLFGPMPERIFSEN